MPEQNLMGVLYIATIDSVVLPCLPAAPPASLRNNIATAIKHSTPFPFWQEDFRQKMAQLPAGGRGQVHKYRVCLRLSARETISTTLSGGILSSP